MGDRVFAFWGITFFALFILALSNELGYDGKLTMKGDLKQSEKVFCILKRLLTSF